MQLWRKSIELICPEVDALCASISRIVNDTLNDSWGCESDESGRRMSTSETNVER